MLKFFFVILIFLAVAFARIDLRFNPGLYFRYSDFTDGTPSSFSLASAELTFIGNLGNNNRDIVGVAYQIHIAGSMHGWAKSLHQGIAYASIPTGIGKPTIKIGQQVIPFGLLSWYDTHGRLFQNPYVFTLGQRIDAGVSMQGFVGPIDWWYMVSNGSGPNIIDEDDNKVQTLRIAHSFSADWYDLTVGLSLLRGVLPVFNRNPLSDLMAEPDSLRMKNRLAIDGRFSNPYFEILGEVIIGTDGSWNTISEINNQRKTGGYLGLDIPIIAGIDVIGMYSHWQPDPDNEAEEQILGIGLDYTPVNLNNINLQIILNKNLGQDDYRVVGQLGIIL